MSLAAPPPASARFAIGPLCWGIDEAEFARWIERAAPRDRIVYAGGPVLPRKMAVVRAVTVAKDAGLVGTHVVRENGACLYVAERRAESGGGESAARAWPVPGSIADRMLGILTDAAAAGRPCPTNAVLSISLSLTGAEQARYIFGQLVNAGLIAVENRGPKLRRIVTIVKSGERTKG